MKTNSHMRAGSHAQQPTQLTQRLSHHKQPSVVSQPFHDKTNRQPKGNQTQRTRDDPSNDSDFPYDFYKGLSNMSQLHHQTQNTLDDPMPINSRNGVPSNIDDVHSFKGSFIQHLQQQSEPTEQDENIMLKDQTVSSVLHESTKGSFSSNTHRLITQDSMQTTDYNLVPSRKNQLSDQKKALYMKLRQQDPKEVTLGNQEVPIQKRATLDNRMSTISSNQMQESSSIQNSEVEKWKKFGYLVAESYDEMKKEHEKLKQERETDKKIIQALKDQVTKLKQIISARNIDEEMDQCYKQLIENLQQENAQLKKNKADKEVLQQEITFQGDIINKLNEKLQKAKIEINQLKAQQQKAQSASFSLSKSNVLVNQSQTSRNDNTYYKKMSHQHLRECSQLADELICLRSDIDKSQMQQTVRSSSQSMQMDRRGLSNSKAWPPSIQGSEQKRNSFSGTGTNSKTVSAITSPSNAVQLRRQHHEDYPTLTPQITNQIVNTTTKLKKQDSMNAQALSPIGNQEQNRVLSNSREKSSKRKVAVTKVFRDEDKESNPKEKTNTNSLMKIMLQNDHKQPTVQRGRQRVEDYSKIGNSLLSSDNTSLIVDYIANDQQDGRNSEMSQIPTDSCSMPSVQANLQKQSPYTATYKSFQYKK